MVSIREGVVLMPLVLDRPDETSDPLFLFDQCYDIDEFLVGRIERICSDVTGIESDPSFQENLNEILEHVLIQQIPILVGMMLHSCRRTMHT